MSSLGKQVSDKIMQTIRTKVYDAMVGGFEQLQDETNKDSGRAAAGWVMTTGDNDVNYIPEEYKNAEKRSVDGHQDGRYVNLQKQHRTDAYNISKTTKKANVFQITNNVDYMADIDYRWNPGFFERAVDKIRMDLEDTDEVRLSWQTGLNDDFDDGSAF